MPSHGALCAGVVPGAALLALQSHPVRTSAWQGWPEGQNLDYCRAGCWQRHRPLWVTRVGKEGGGKTPLSPSPEAVRPLLSFPRGVASVPRCPLP